MSLDLPDADSLLPIFANAVQNSPISIVITDHLGNILYINKKFIELTGYEPGDLLGKNIRIRRSSRTAPEVHESLSKAIHDGKAWKGELWNTKKNGEHYLDSVYISPIRSERDEITHFIGLQLDITEQRMLLEKVKSSEESFRMLANSITDVYFAVNMEAAITYWNHRCEEVTRYTAEQSLGKYFFDIFPTLANSDYSNKLLFALNNQLPSSFLYEFTDSNGTTFWEITCYPTGSGLAVIAKDVSEQRRLLKTLEEKNSELKALVDMRDKFFSIIAHDLRSPFQSLHGLSSLLTEELAAGGDPDSIILANKLHNTIRATFNLLQNLLEWAQHELGRVPMVLTGINVWEMVTQSITTLSAAAQQKDIHISNTIDPEISVFADRYMSNSVVNNILSNAVKFSLPGGAIRCFATEGDTTVTIGITDSGVGMNQEKLTQLFTMHAQVSTHGTAGEKGTGLGLLLCKEIMQKLQGAISVESEEGKGTTFFLTFQKFTE